jgi:hypothetical protein
VAQSALSSHIGRAEPIKACKSYVRMSTIDLMSSRPVSPTDDSSSLNKIELVETEQETLEPAEIIDLTEPGVIDLRTQRTQGERTLGLRRRLLSQLKVAFDCGMTVAQVSDEADLVAAKALHADVFKSHGYVSQAQLTGNGRAIDLTEDPYQTHADYFVTKVGLEAEQRVISSARMIYADGALMESFQTYVSQPLIPSARRLLNMVNPYEVVEISGLVRSKGESFISAVPLYQAMWRHSLDCDYRYWLMSCDKGLFRSLRLLFGDVIKPIGDSNFFKGHEVVPAMLDVQTTAEEFTYRAETAVRAGELNHIDIRFYDFFFNGQIS